MLAAINVAAKTLKMPIVVEFMARPCLSPFRERSAYGENMATDGFRTQPRPTAFPRQEKTPVPFNGNGGTQALSARSLPQQR